MSSTAKWFVARPWQDGTRLVYCVDGGIGSGPNHRDFRHESWRKVATNIVLLDSQDEARELARSLNAEAHMTEPSDPWFSA